jgi:hypothetical protein
MLSCNNFLSFEIYQIILQDLRIVTLMKFNEGEFVIGTTYLNLRNTHYSFFFFLKIQNWLTKLNFETKYFKYIYIYTSDT